jgi:hypothetical protein
MRRPARSVGAADRAGPGREPERGAAEVEVEQLLGAARGVDEQVTAGDAEVEVARADIRGDVARAQVEELDVVGVVAADQVAVVGALAVSRLAQHLCGRTGEGSFVGYCDAQHDRAPCGLEVSVDVFQLEPGRQHEHLYLVQQLGDLFGGALAALMLGRHPRLGRLLDDLLADRMDASLQGGDGARAGGPRGGLRGQLREQVVEGLHEQAFSQAYRVCSKPVSDIRVVTHERCAVDLVRVVG